MALRIEDKNNPNQLLMQFRNEAPWCMLKGKDLSCLCTTCKGMNGLRRGWTKASCLLCDILKTNVDQCEDDSVVDWEQ